MERLRALDRRVLVIALLLVPTLWWGPDLLWPYRRVVNLGAPGETVAVLGDSIPAGFGDTVGTERAWPTLVAQRLHLTVVNQSVAGDTTDRGLARLDSVLDTHPRLVVVELGGNDMMSRAGADHMRATLDAIFERIQQRGAMVMYVSVPSPLSTTYPSAWSAACERRGVWHVRNVLDGVFGVPSMMYDSIHPNAEGHAHIAERMTREIEGLLRAADRQRGTH